jgi:FAD binding domain
MIQKGGHTGLLRKQMYHLPASYAHQRPMKCPRSFRFSINHNTTHIRLVDSQSVAAGKCCKLVSLILLTLNSHQTWSGASNMQGGVTIDLSDLNQITVYQQNSVVSLGPGLRWQNVYDALEPYQLAVLGGRWGNVGVGGLLTGGMNNLHLT